MAKTTRQALEEALIDNWDDLSAHAAYADLLQEAGDPRGELIATQLALESPSLDAKERRRLTARERKLLRAHEHEWLGSLAPVLLDINWPRCEYRWERGQLAALHVQGDFGVEMARVLARASKELRFLRELLIDDPAYVGNDRFEPGPDVPAEWDGDQAACLYVLRKAKWLLGLHVFRVGPMTSEDYTDHAPSNVHAPGDQAHHLIRQMRRIEELYLMAYQTETSVIFKLPMPHLRVLQVYHASDYPLRELAHNRSLTNLTHLLCHPKARMHYDREPHIRFEGLSAVLRTPHLPALTHLRLRLCDAGDDGCREVVASGALKRLKVLDLRHGRITDEGARALAACPDLRDLESLDVAWNRLTPAGVAALRATGVTVEARAQYGPDDEEDLYLYQGDYE
jgi:uncharacterized protein (TIGR02996 family)